MDLLREFRTALRRLRRSWAFASAAIFSLAFALGGATLLLGLADQAVLEPISSELSASAIRLYTSVPEGTPYSPTSLADFYDIEESAEGLATFGWSYKAIVDVSIARSESRQTLIERVSSNYFQILGMEQLVPPDGAGKVVVVSASFGRDLLGHQNRGLSPGATLRIDGQILPVVGVAPPAFHGLTPGIPATLWVMGAPTKGVGRARTQRQLDVVGLLQGDSSLDGLKARLQQLSDRLAVQYGASNEGRRFTIVGLREARLNPDADRYLSLLGAMLVGTSLGFVLLVCLNLTGFLAARAGADLGRLATQRVLGASVVRLLMTPVIEACILVGGGWIGAILVSRGGQQLTRSLTLPTLPGAGVSGEVSWRVGVVLLGVSLVAVGTLGIAPCISVVRRARHEGGLAGLSAGVVRGHPAGRKGIQAILTTQVWIAVVLSALAGLAVDSLVFRRQLDSGFRTAGIGVAEISIRDVSGSQQRQAWTRASEAFASGPVAITDWLPLSPGHSSLNVHVGNGTPTPGGSVSALRTAVSQDYFDILQIPLVGGTTGGPLLDDGGPLEVVVTRRLIEELGLAVQDAVGARLTFPGWEGADEAVVIGVASDHRVRYLTEAAPPVVYFRLDQTPSRHLYLLAPSVRLRSAGPVDVALRLDSDIELLGSYSLEDQLRSSLAGPRALAVGFSLVAFFAIVMVGLGVYGVTAHSVILRRHEMAVRASVGATPSALVRTLIVQELRPVASGMVIGVALAVGLSRILAGFFPGTNLLAPTTLAAVLICPIVAVLLALAPALASTSLEPMTGLRPD